MKTLKLTPIIYSFFLLYVLTGCSDNTNEQNPTDTSGDWLIPSNQVFDGGPGKDGIPALTNPNFINVQEASYLSDNDLVLGFVSNGEARAYPHKILDWHEIINDDLGSQSFAVIYCPLTGTGIGWDRNLLGGKTTFGVSGLLYNTNVIPYDRLTDSNWSQLALLAVNGRLSGTKPNVVNLVETSWKTWRELYPTTKVVSTSTGHNRNYQQYPYGDYRTNNNTIIFPVSKTDNRLPAKQRGLAIIVDNKAKIYSMGLFGQEDILFEDQFAGSDLVVVGNKTKNFIVALPKRLLDGTAVELSLVEGQGPAILQDTSGNKYDAFGNVVAGPRLGQKLQSIPQMIGYWFAWAPFYETVEIFEPQN
jgi:hypothetical protein